MPSGIEVSTEAELSAAHPAKPAIALTGSRAGRVSHCEPFEGFIKAGLDADLSAQRIYQDLVIEQQFAGGYDSPNRFSNRCQRRTSSPRSRVEAVQRDRVISCAVRASSNASMPGRRYLSESSTNVLSRSKQTWRIAGFTSQTPLIGASLAGIIAQIPAEVGQPAPAAGPLTRVSNSSFRMFRSWSRHNKPQRSQSPTVTGPPALRLPFQPERRPVPPRPDTIPTWKKTCKPPDSFHTSNHQHR